MTQKYKPRPVSTQNRTHHFRVKYRKYLYLKWQQSQRLRRNKISGQEGGEALEMVSTSLLPCTHPHPSLLVMGLTSARQMQQRIVGSCRRDLHQSPGLVYTKDDCCYGGGHRRRHETTPTPPPRLPQPAENAGHSHSSIKRGELPARLVGESVCSLAGRRRSITSVRKISELLQHQREALSGLGGQEVRRSRSKRDVFSLCHHVVSSAEQSFSRALGSLRGGA